MFTGQPARTAFGRTMAVSALLHAGLLLLLLGWGGPLGSPVRTARFVSVALVSDDSSPASPGEHDAGKSRKESSREDGAPSFKKGHEAKVSVPQRSLAHEIPAVQAAAPLPEAPSSVSQPSRASVPEAIPEPVSYGRPAGPVFASVDPDPRPTAQESRGGEDAASQRSGEGITEPETPGGREADVTGAALVARIQEAIEAALVYPPLARKRGLQGTVLAGFRVDGEGRPLDIRVLRSSGHGILDRAVVRTIRRAWPYPPVADAIEVPVRFRLVAEEPPGFRPDR